MMAITITTSKKYHIILIISSLALLLLISAVHSSTSIGDVDIDFDFDFNISGLADGTTSSSSSSSSSCHGTTIGECVDEDDEEFLVDSESTRRILRGRRYISYGALRRNYVPCSRRGASYYNCRPGGSANPYRRGCSRISRCRRR